MDPSYPIQICEEPFLPPFNLPPLKADDDEGVRVDAERDRLHVAEAVADEGAERPVT